MPSNNSKYSQEVREETAKFIIESGKSATSVGEEKGISEKKPRDASADAKRIKQL